MSTFNKPLIIGLAGTFASGKDSLAKHLEADYQVKHISTGDIVRQIALAEYGSVERPILYKTANELRTTRGNGILSEIALKQYDEYRDQFPGGVCVSGFRAWAEAKVLRDNGGIIVFTDAPSKLRYQRTLNRARDNEKLNSYEEFMARERRENGEENSQWSIIGIKKFADIVLDNEDDLRTFLKKADQALGV